MTRLLDANTAIIPAIYLIKFGYVNVRCIYLNLAAESLKRFLIELCLNFLFINISINSLTTIYFIKTKKKNRKKVLINLLIKIRRN